MCKECDAALEAAQKETPASPANPVFTGFQVNENDDTVVQGSDTSLDELSSEPDLFSDQQQ